MTTEPPRRARGEAAKMPAVYAQVSDEAFGTAERVADRLGVSKAKFIELLLCHVNDDLDDRGVPTWWSLPLPSSPVDDGLPLALAQEARAAS